MALTFGLRRSIWARWASSTSPAESSRARMRRLSSVAVRKQISLSDIDTLPWRLNATESRWLPRKGRGFSARQGIGPARRRISW